VTAGQQVAEIMQM